MFRGFKAEASDFLWELKFNNERPWFLQNKERFERVLRIPFSECANTTYDLFCEKAPEKDWLLHISRIYRDARRLYGRGPYKDHLWFSIKEQDGLLRGPMFWFELGADEYSYGMGFYSATPDQMQVYRRAIDANPAAFINLISGLEATKFELDAEPYKRPKAERGELLNPWYNAKHVGVSFTAEFDESKLGERLPEVLAKDLVELMPLYEFFMGVCRASEN